jgi:molybdenum cofactor cytidylyltransferase
VGRGGPVAFVGLVTAAGRGERFAAANPAAPPKMLAPVAGVPMIRRSVQSLLGAGLERCIVVTTTALAGEVETALSGLAVRVVVNPEPDRGMLSSIQHGLLAIRADARPVILPGDMPYVRPETVAQLVSAAARTGRTTLPRLDKHRGHPVVCSAGLRARITEAGTGATLRDLLDAESVACVDVIDAGVRHDVDVPE